MSRLRALLLILSTAATATAQRVEWPTFGGDLASTKYSALTDINRSNVSRLAKVWEWSTNETANTTTRTRPGNFQATPLMLGDTLFLSTPYNRVVAFPLVQLIRMRAVVNILC